MAGNPARTDQPWLGLNADYVIVNPGDDFFEKVKELPTDREAYLFVMPGEYPVKQTPWYVNSVGLHIIGVLDADGQRPKLFSSEESPANAAIAWRPPNGNLHVENLEIGHFGGDGIFAGTGGYRDHSQNIVIRNVYIHHTAHGIMVGMEPADSRNDTILIENSHFSHASTHNVYIDRIDTAVIKNSKFESPGSVHALKVAAVNLVVDGNTFANAQVGGGIDRDVQWPQTIWGLDSYIGGAVLSLIAGQQGIVVNNTIDWTMLPQETGTVIIKQQPRHAIDGNDVAYDPAAGRFVGADAYVTDGSVQDRPPIPGSPMWSPEYWQAVRDAGLDMPAAATNPYLLKMFYTNNTINYYGSDRDAHKTVVFGNYGTYPNRQKAPGDWRAEPIPEVPAGWVEISRSFIGTTTLVGPAAFTGKAPESLYRDINIDALLDASGKPLNPAQRTVIVDGVDGQALPDWFLTTWPAVTPWWGEDATDASPMIGGPDAADAFAPGDASWSLAILGLGGTDSQILGAVDGGGIETGAIGGPVDDMLTFATDVGGTDAGGTDADPFVPPAASGADLILGDQGGGAPGGLDADLPEGGALEGGGIELGDPTALPDLDGAPLPADDLSQLMFDAGGGTVGGGTGGADVILV